MTLTLDHIQLAIPKDGEPKARAFWCDLIDLKEIPKPEALQSRGGLWLQLIGSELHLGIETPFAPAQKAHPGFQTKDLTSLAARLTNANHPLTWDTAIKNRQRFFTQDPFGNRLEFLQLP